MVRIFQAVWWVTFLWVLCGVWVLDSIVFRFVFDSIVFDIIVYVSSLFVLYLIFVFFFVCLFYLLMVLLLLDWSTYSLVKNSYKSRSRSRSHAHASGD